MRIVAVFILAALLLTGTLSAEDTTPAVFQVTTEVINPNPGAFTATTGPLHILVDYNYEPMVWRNRRFQVTQDATGKVFADLLDWFDSYAPGYWDGSTLRVLRAENGKISQKLLGKVAKFHHGNWTHFNSALVPGDKTAIQFTFDGWNKRGQEWWLSLTAVDKQGRESARSNAVRVVNPDIPGDKRAKIENPFTIWPPRLDEKAEGAPPSAPANFTAKVDENTGVVSLSWKAVPGDIAGYRLHWTYIDPAKHQGTFLEMDKENGGDTFAFKKGDLFFLTRRATTFNRNIYSPRIWGTPEANPPDFAPQIIRPGEWASSPIPFELVPHPGKLPADVLDAGETCMKIVSTEPGLVVLRKYNHADTTQNWYRVLDPAKTYVVEFLARQEKLANPVMQFHLTGPLAADFAPIDFTMTGEWKKFRQEFKVSRMLTEPSGVGQMGLQFNGPGTVWLDNFRVYEKDAGLVRHNPVDVAALKASGMVGIRTHDTCKTYGYTAENLLGHPDMGLSTGTEVYRANLSALLKEFAAIGVFPWLQIEFTMDELEWKAIVEYIAAPYDPAKDTPKSKPWAYRRVQHGQKEPYTKVFPRILFEFSNENWNMIMAFNVNGLSMTDTVTGKTYNGGEIYGMLQEYTIGVMKSSPYWTPEMEKKAEFVIGGWSLTDFGYNAARFSPSSKYNLIADYNGGWDAGEGPETVGNLDQALLKTLIFGAQHSRPNAIRLRNLRDKFAAETGIRTELGTYEAGPGYNLDGLNGVRMTPEMVEFESRVMKSLAAGTSTLDCFLTQATQGAKLQNFFTFSRNRHYWTSHAEERYGGQAYPSWMALSMFNLYAVGDILAVLTQSVPTRNAPAVGNRAAMPDAPEVAVYATRNGDKLAVIAISRKLDKSTPTTIHLPITSAKKVTLHTLTGDPRANNLDAENIKPASKELPASVVSKDFVLDETRGAPGGLPPASVFMYVFEGANFAKEPPVSFVVPAAGQSDPASALPVRFHVGLGAQPKSFTNANLVLAGEAEPQEAVIEEIPGTYGMEYIVSIPATMSDGNVELKLANLATASGTPISASSASVTLRFPKDMLLPLIAWNFGALQSEDKPESREWRGNPIKSTRKMTVLADAELTASTPTLLEDNIHYNNDGAGTWIGSGQMQNSSHYYSFTLTPIGGRALNIGQVVCGFWSGASDGSELKPRLEVWRDGKKVGEAPFKADVPIDNKGNLGHNAGIRAVADTSKIAALQMLSKPIELRIVFAGLESEGGVFGIGKLGKDKDDLIILGRISALK